VVDTESHAPAIAFRHLNRRVLVAGLTAVVVLLAVVALFRWHGGTQPAVKNGTHPAPVGRALPTPVSGAVVVVGSGPPPVNGSPQNFVRPYAHARILVTGTTTSGAHISRRLTADRQGRFALHLRPGHYTVTANTVDAAITSSSRSRLAVFPHTKLTVVRGQPAHARVVEHEY
jgi:hypothetical protein